MVNKKSLNIFLLVLWMLFIFIMSSLEGDASNAKSYFIVDIFKNIGLINSIRYEDGLNFIIRKSGHFLEYLVLAILLYRAMKEYICNEYFMLFIIMFVFLYACSDEIHQLFVVGREGKFFDVIIDTLGGVAGILTLKITKFIKRGIKSI